MQYLVHIGYPKAASTFLQNTLFSGAHDQIKPLGYSPNGKAIHKPGKGLFHTNYNAPNGTPLKAVLPFIFDAKAARDEVTEGTYANCEITCLTNESWTGHPFSGGVTAQIYADHIHDVLPQAKILIITRRQEDMLLSIYADALERYTKTISFEDFLFVPDQDMTPAPSPFFYCYDGLVSHYRDRFGAGNVCVMPFELLKEKGESFFLAEICKFLGVEPQDIESGQVNKNARDYKKYAVLKKLRWLNALSSSHKGLDRLGVNIKGVRHICQMLYPMSEAKAKDIREADLKQARAFLAPYAKSSNARLQEFMPYDLKALGYMLP